MTKRGSFKRAVRRQARETGARYTQALASIHRDELEARVAAKWHGKERLPAHLADRYGIDVASLTQLSPHGGGVLRVDRHDGPGWVARLFPPARPPDRVKGDAEILQFLEEHDFPSERCAHAEPVSVHEGQTVLVTTFVEGTPGEVNKEHEYALADALGRLHALPAASGAMARDGGAFCHDPLREGRPREDLTAAMSFLAAIEADVPRAQRAPFDSLIEQVEAADACDDLPEALTHPDMVDRNVLVTADGTRVTVDWKGAGRGPRLSAVAFLLHGAGLQPGGDSEIVDAIVAGYSAHVRLEPEELARLAAAMRVRPLYFACWYYWRAVSSGNIPTGDEGWWPGNELTDAIAAKAVAAFAQQ